MAAREPERLPVPYFHVVFTLPVAIGDIAYHNKAMIYDLLFTASAQTMLTIAADPKHLGARIGITLRAQFAAEQFHARIAPNDAMTLSRLHGLCPLKKA